MQTFNKEISPIKGRLLAFAKEKGIPKTTLCSSISISYENLKGKSLSSEFGGDVIGKILSVYKEINAEWLITGHGNMLKEEAGNMVSDMQTIYRPKTAEKQIDNQIVYLYDIEATAGLKSLLENKNQNIIDTIRIPNLPKCDGAVHVVGDSMYPILKSGDIVLYKEVHDIEYGIFWGEMYLLSVAVDDEEYITVKYLQKSDINDTFVKLVSHNPHHNPKDIPISSIRALALIKASIRLNTIV
ncbi:S24 family peptidase [Porphyromonas macacae]|uniref:Peptidase S24/S26A/S26B/S26C domain-containing protein n=1 Tax=Porphyromonas macacae TaxID=28115 RepID=A0A379DH46_9PORP|nr:S24 family peptidase [Porphyromonas macacae]SUB77353.1 Uncharacterised protein [Porphyromonas macacae]